MTITIIIMLILVGLLGGFFSGLFGIGGGVVMVPLMMVLIGYSQHQAQGTSLAVLAVPVTLLAAYNYYNSSQGEFNWNYAIIIALCFVVGGYLGSKLAINMNDKLLKKIFSLLMLFVAIKMFFSK